MSKKIIDTVRATVLVLACILVPLGIGYFFLKSSVISDSEKCLDTFITTECVGISKYVGVQFENTSRQINELMRDLRKEKTSSKKKIQTFLTSLLKKNSNISSIGLYNSKNGKCLMSTLANYSSSRNFEGKSKEKINYSLEQLEDATKTIVVKYLIFQKFDETSKTNNNGFWTEIVVKWNHYETYMQQMYQGSFPRAFFIISPDCRRYVSMNALPSNLQSNRYIAALGLHLAGTIQTIKDGLSNVPIEGKHFKVMKSEIKTPDNIVGNKFFVLVVADKQSINTLSSSLFNSIQNGIYALIILWLFVSIFISRFLNKAKDQLEISKTVSDNTPLAVTIFHAATGKIMQINLSAMTIFRIANENVENFNMWDVILADEDRNYIKNAMSSNINVLNYEVLVQGLGGGIFWAICSATPVTLEEEKYIVLATLDINRRKEIEKKLANNAELLEQQVLDRTADLEKKAKELEETSLKLEKAKQQADEANAAKSKFLTNMSNEFKTPINAIIGYSEILQEEANDRKDTVSADDLRKIIGSAKHLLSLIDEILDLSKIEAGKTQILLENVNITDIIKDIEGVTMPLIADHDNTLHIECAKGIGMIYTDQTKLRQCLLNLLSNAAKFTEFGKITLRVTQITKGGVDFIEFSVMDTGIGIAPDRIDTIFDPFHAKDAQNSGAGLGLSLTKKYTEYLGGNVVVESEEGVGSKFTIRVPRTSTVESNEFIEIKNPLADEDDLGDDVTSEIFAQDIPTDRMVPFHDIGESPADASSSSYTLTS
ncbi:MAG: PAS domain-containing sensor histidine kinase [Holosporaceae bacterium]|jgi:PAS domain S-box-containing protein|nr:PAS domain-containing sensor histidine kinase [Holosporaceae bacterium]